MNELLFCMQLYTVMLFKYQYKSENNILNNEIGISYLNDLMIFGNSELTLQLICILTH